MSKTPIFGTRVIKHKSDKARKDFILDLIFISMGEVALKVALTEDYSKEDGIKSLHKNKHRKQLAKIKEAYELLVKQKKVIIELTSLRDGKTVDYKITQLSDLFISKIGLTKKELSLELLAICFMDYGLNREKRKTEINKHLKGFCNYSLLYKTIGMNVEKAGIKMTDEYELAKSFIDKVRY